MLQRYQEEDGATAVEYALMAGLIAVAIAATVGFLGVAIVEAFDGFRAQVGW